MRRWLCGLAVYPVLWVSVASAQPLLVPGRDVAVVYRLDGAAAERIPGGAPDGVRVLWDALNQRLRAEPLGGPIYALTDLQRRTVEVVFAGQSAFIEARMKGGDPVALLAGRDVHFTQRGVAHVLGLACTEWSARSEKFDGTGCVTADGVILRAQGLFDGRAGSATAQSVHYGPQPASAFVPPEGYARIALPGGK